MKENACKSYTNKGLVYRIYKALLQLNSRKTTQFKNQAKNLNRTFLVEDVQMANTHMKKVLNIINHQRNAKQTREIAH